MPYSNNFLKSASYYETSILSKYKQQIKLHSVWLNKIKAMLPDYLAQRALFCVVSDKQLSLYTDSSVWASQLRFYHKNILTELNKAKNIGFESLKIKILLKTNRPDTIQNCNIPTKKTINLILSYAKCQKNSQLKEALSKLGKTLHRLNP